MWKGKWSNLPSSLKRLNDCNLWWKGLGLNTFLPPPPPPAPPPPAHRLLHQVRALLRDPGRAGLRQGADQAGALPDPGHHPRGQPQAGHQAVERAQGRGGEALSPGEPGWRAGAGAGFLKTCRNVIRVKSRARITIPNGYRKKHDMQKWKSEVKAVGCLYFKG